MQRVAVVFVVVVLAAIAVSIDAADQDSLFRVRKLTDRVLIFTEISPWESNHVVIVGARLRRIGAGSG